MRQRRVSVFFLQMDLYQYRNLTSSLPPSPLSSPPASRLSSIIIWSLTGDQLISLHGHTSFIYALAFIPPSPDSPPDAEPHLASVSEDRTLRIWNELGKNIQTIPIPATSVWSVTATSEGDVVTGSSDGTVRVWSRDQSKYASENERKALEEEVGKQQVDQYVFHCASDEFCVDCHKGC